MAGLVVLAGVLGGCEGRDVDHAEDGAAVADPEPGPEPSAEPYPSTCVDQYLEALEAMGTPLPDEPPENPVELLLYDRLTYRISGEDYLRWAVLRYVDPEQVPEEYRFGKQPPMEGPDPLTGVFVYASWEMQCLPEGAYDRVLDDLGLGPSAPLTD